MLVFGHLEEGQINLVADFLDLINLLLLVNENYERHLVLFG